MAAASLSMATINQDMDPYDGLMCDVCEKFPPKSRALYCRHGFCHDCFRRYVDGSLDELNNFLRCCICGDISDLTKETHKDVVSLRFGRDLFPKLVDPIGLAVKDDGEFVTIDKEKQRGYIFLRNGEIKKDFPYVHNSYPMIGLAISNTGHLVAPYTDHGRKVITYFSSHGDVMMSTFF